MRALVAMDSFKGNLTSAQAGDAVALGLEAEGFETEVVIVADGGEGTGEALAQSLGGQWEYRGARGPLGYDVMGRYLLLPGRCGLVEVASASGLPLVSPSKRNPLVTNSYGTGQLVLALVAKGAAEVMLTLGGSATVDGGWGLLDALGLKAYDASGQKLRPCGGNLVHIARLDAEEVWPLFEKVVFWTIADVTNPLLGPNGAAAVFGPQKGARAQDIPLLEEGLAHWHELLAQVTGRSVAHLPGTGAAGGIGAAIAAFTGRAPAPGFAVVARALGLEKKVASADVVITGEGRLDSQSTGGKLVGGMMGLCHKASVPLVALVGGVRGDVTALYDQGLSAVFCIADGVSTFQQALERSRADLERTARQVARLLSLQSRSSGS